MMTVTELLEAIAELGGELGDEARRLLPVPIPVGPDDPAEFQAVVTKWLDDRERVIWRAQSDPVLRPHCEAFTREIVAFEKQLEAMQ